MVHMHPQKSSQTQLQPVLLLSSAVRERLLQKVRTYCHTWARFPTVKEAADMYLLSNSLFSFYLLDNYRTHMQDSSFSSEYATMVAFSITDSNIWTIAESQKSGPDSLGIESGEVVLK